MRSLLLSLCLLSAVGCIDSSSQDEIVDHASFDGAVHLPLTGRSSDGKTYRLRNATFEIAGPAMFTLSDKDQRAANADEDALVATLPAGQYNLYLRPGWELIEVAADGSVTKIEAQLKSENPIPFAMGQTLDSRIKIKLVAADREIVLGGEAAPRMSSISL